MRDPEEERFWAKSRVVACVLQPGDGTIADPAEQDAKRANCEWSRHSGR
jgi:hypothetical protein